MSGNKTFKPNWTRQILVLLLAYAIAGGVYFYGGQDHHEQLKAAQEREILHYQRGSNGPGTAVVIEFDEAELEKLVGQPDLLKQGAQLFQQKCSACHGENAEGRVGPSLVDQQSLHGDKLSDVKRVITFGVEKKGMLAWKDLLSEQEINALVVYLHKIKS